MWLAICVREGTCCHDTRTRSTVSSYLHAMEHGGKCAHVLEMVSSCFACRSVSPACNWSRKLVAIFLVFIPHVIGYSLQKLHFRQREGSSHVELSGRVGFIPELTPRARREPPKRPRDCIYTGRSVKVTALIFFDIRLTPACSYRMPVENGTCESQLSQTRSRGALKRVC